MQHLIRITRSTLFLFVVMILLSTNASSINKNRIHQDDYISPLHVSLAAIPPVLKSEIPMRVTIQSNDNGYQGKVYLSSALGKVEPTYIELVDGKWTGDIIFYESGKNNYLTILWGGDGKVRSGNNKSDSFDVTDPSGYIASDAMLTGKVISANSHQILESATVQLFNGDPKNGGQKIYSTVTGDDGSYTFKNIIPGIYYQVIEKAGYQKRSEEIAIVPKRTITGDRSLYCVCNNKNSLTPILLVPGIMGSHTAGDLDVYPRLPVVPPAWDSGGLALLNPSDYVGWNTLKASLKNLGYVEGCTLIDVPYDWSLFITDARNQYLVPWIDQAKLLSGSNKVDIVAHSMGGLLTRSYVQSENYIDDVRKFAVVGTPNKGADLAYYLWEGGDPITADNTQPPSLLGEYFYSNTLDYYYIDRHSDQICQFDTYTPISCDNDKVYDFLHYKVPSTGQLMPIFNSSLIKYGKNIPILQEENTLLKALSSNPVCYNPKGCVDPFGNNYSFAAPENIFTKDSTITHKVNTMLFIGITTAPPKDTIQSIYVEPQPPYYKGSTYKDGIPQGTAFLGNYGDGVVLVDSVRFDEAFQKKLDYAFRSVGHSSLISTFTPDIVEFITRSSHKVQVERQAQPKVLAISIMGRMQPDLISIIDPKGHPINYLADSSVKRFFKADRASLEIENPADGNYKILLNSPYNEDYELSVLYHNNDSNKLFARRYYGYFDNSSKEFSFTINSDYSDQPISFDRSFYTPSNLKLSNVANKIQLTWQDNTGDANQDIDHYEIYYKPDSKPYMRLLTQIKTKKYLTKHDWQDATTNTYAVRAILKNGASTFLSPLAFFIPASSHGPQNLDP